MAAVNEFGPVPGNKFGPCRVGGRPGRAAGRSPRLAKRPASFRCVLSQAPRDRLSCAPPQRNTLAMLSGSPISRLCRTMLLGLGVGMAAFGGMARADSFTPEQRADIIAIMREALKQDPSIL